MRTAFATLVFAGLAVANPVANPVPQAVTSAIAPSGSPPAGCYPNYQGTFVIGPVNVSSSGSDKRDLEERNTQLGITLQNGILTDPLGRTGYIAANEQFQFDGPPQAGAIWTAGFTVCTNRRLTLGSQQHWWRCLSGNFYNLYFENQGGQCIESYLLAYPINGAGGPIPGSVTGSQVITETAGTTTAGTSTKNTAGSSSASPSGSASGSTSGTVQTPPPANATVTSSSAAGNSSSVAITGSSTTATTVVPPGHQTTITTAGTKTTVGQQHQTTTTTAGGGSPTAAASSSSSSVSPGAAPLATVRGELFGLAAGVLALAAL